MKLDESLIDDFDDILDLSQDFIEGLKKEQLFERIVIKGNNASIEIDKNLVSIFEDITKTISATKTIYKQLLNSKSITSSYLKYFRLIQANCEKTVEYLTKVFKDNRIIQRLGQLVSIGEKTITSLVKVINKTIDKINTMINMENYKISKIKPPIFNNQQSFIKSPEYQPKYQQWME